MPAHRRRRDEQWIQARRGRPRDGLTQRPAIIEVDAARGIPELAVDGGTPGVGPAREIADTSRVGRALTARANRIFQPVQQTVEIDRYDLRGVDAERVLSRPRTSASRSPSRSRPRHECPGNTCRRRPPLARASASVFAHRLCRAECRVRPSKRLRIEPSSQRHHAPPGAPAAQAASALASRTRTPAFELRTNSGRRRPPDRPAFESGRPSRKRTAAANGSGNRSASRSARGRRCR